MTLIRDAVGRLRTIGSRQSSANRNIDLYRGMKNVEIAKMFQREGGCELAPMSTTSDAEVAVQYSASDAGVVIRLRTESAMERGADLSYLSAFPGEKEYLFPPLCYLQPTGRDWDIEVAGRNFSVIEVRPRL